MEDTSISSETLKVEAEAKYIANEKEDEFRHSLLKENIVKNQKTPGNREKSVLKVQKLVNRFRRFADTNKNAILNEISRLDVSMHLSEICDGLCEGAIRLKDVNALMEICSLLFRQYGADFSCAVCSSASRAFLESADVSVVSNSTRRKALPRLMFELVLVGVCQDAEALPKMINALCDLSRPPNDPLSLHNVSVLEMLCRKFDTAILGGNPGNRQTALDTALGRSLQRHCTLSKATQAALRTKLIDFYRNNATLLLEQAESAVEQQSALNQQKRITKGQVDPESEAKYQNALASLTRLKTQLEALADILAQPPPSVEASNKELGITRIQPTTGDSTSTNGGVRNDKELVTAGGSSCDVASSPWDDDAERDFYANVLDLSEAVPGTLLGISKENKDSKDSSLPIAQFSSASPTPVKDDAKPSNEDVNNIAVVEPPQSDAKFTAASLPLDASAGISKASLDTAADRKIVLLDQFFEKLTQATIASEIDNLAINFFYDQLNAGKTNRKRLIKLILSTHRNDLFVLPALARFVATINPYSRDVVQSVTEGVLHEYKELAAQRDPLKLESRIKAARFLGELCKFGLIPTGTILDVLNELLEDFSHINVEVVCHLVQCCGRYLLHYKGLGERFRNTILTRMMRMRVFRNLPVFLEVMIEDSYFQMFPSETSIRPKNEKPVMHRYINYLITIPLQRGMDAQVVRSIRRLDWGDEKIHKWLRKALLCTVQRSTIAYQNLGTIASLLCALAPGYPEFVVHCIDSLVEAFQLSMERNDFREAPYRIRSIKLIGELFNYRLIGTVGILDILYHLIGFGGPTSHKCSSSITFRRLATLTGNSYLLNQSAEADKETYTSDHVIASAHQGEAVPLVEPTGPEDPPDDFFRIRLICVLLQTCGQYFTRGIAKDKMDLFLAFFQRYLIFKKALPMNIHYLVLDALATVRPKSKLLTSLEDIDNIILTTVSQDIEIEEQREDSAEDEEEETQGEVEVCDDDDEPTISSADGSEEDSSYSETEEDEESETTSEKEEEENALIDDEDDESSKGNLETVEAAMFDIELLNVVGESIREAKSNAALMRTRLSPVEEIRLPNLNKFADLRAGADDIPADRLRVRLITRSKGKDKVHVKALDIPKDSRLSQALTHKETEDAEDHARLKQFVLDSVIRSRKQEVVEREDQIRRQLFIPAGKSNTQAPRRSAISPFKNRQPAGHLSRGPQIVNETAILSLTPNGRGIIKSRHIINALGYSIPS